MKSWITDFDFEVQMPGDMMEAEDYYDVSLMVPIELTMTEHHRYYLTNAMMGSPFLSEDVKLLLQ